MHAYQERYIANAREIKRLMDFSSTSASDFHGWLEERRQASQTIQRLRAENIQMLQEHLFPTLDTLFSADLDEIASLEAYADGLMDWKTNLDCGVYIVIHDALLNLYRIRRDRNQVIKELYKLGMGYYYRNKNFAGVEDPAITGGRFQNEMLFTEAGSYIRYFEEIEDEATKGYIIRALANIAICTQDKKRKVAVSARVLQIIQDEHYRSLAPGLPWDVFLRRTHQQMSANRTLLSRGDFSREEMAAILDSCYEVFKPENQTENPSVRWLWPYYEMEFNCGYVDLTTTLERLEDLISRTRYDQYDDSGLYGNVFLPALYGRMLKKNKPLQKEWKRVQFLRHAYAKMEQTLLTCPLARMDDYFYYMLDVAITEYFEVDTTFSYQSMTQRLMQRFGGEIYVRARKAGDMIALCCDIIYARDPAFFDDIPLLKAVEDPAEKHRVLLQYARDCGLYQDFGLIKINMHRTVQTRNLFEDEFHLYQLHTVSGYEDLRARKSTEIFADIALGHHRWYNGTDGYPSAYVRTDSPYRQMVDIAAFVSALLEENNNEDCKLIAAELLQGEQKRFSPMVAAYLCEGDALEQLAEVMRSDQEACYRDVYRELLESVSQRETS